MGHGDRPPNGPEHKVWLDGYFIGKYEVTNAEWKVFMDSASTPATLILPMCHWKNGAIPQGRENHPVVCLRQDDAKRYCYWLSTATGRDIRLPTEAQWEKAARGPQANDFPWGNVWDDQRCNSGWRLAQQFAFKPKDEGDDWEMKFGEFLWKTPEGDGIRALGGNTMPVGSFPSGRSAYGCYDMAGNTWEWCSDWYRADYYTFKDAMRNPQGPSKEETEPVRWSGPGREITAVLRGGAWSSPSGFCKTWPRKFHAPGNRSLSTGPGFRIVVRLAR
jgi:formylglycine-generating enzyme required for sulfatase activity